jgi:hypothetical protein
LIAQAEGAREEAIAEGRRVRPKKLTWGQIGRAVGLAESTVADKWQHLDPEHSGKKRGA